MRSHISLIVTDVSKSVEFYKLERAGLVKRTEEGSDCCYARQDKVWFSDPDGNAWEVFYVHEQLPVVERPGASACGNVTDSSCCA